MLLRPFRRVVLSFVAAAALVAAPRAIAADAEVQLQLADLLTSETRYHRSARRLPQRHRHRRHRPGAARAHRLRPHGAAGGAVSGGAARSGDAQGSRAARRERFRRMPMLCGRPACSTRPKRRGATRCGDRPTIRAPATGWPARWPRGRASTRRWSKRRPPSGSRRATASCITRSAPSTSAWAASSRRPPPTATTSDLLPNKDHSDKAAWSRSQVRFLRSFGERQPMAIDEAIASQLHTVDFRVVDDKVLVKARVNGGRLRISCSTARSRRPSPARPPPVPACGRSPTPSAPASARSACAACSSLGRHRRTRVRHPQDPQRADADQGAAMRRGAEKETESFSPMAFGLSMISTTAPAS